MPIKVYWSEDGPFALCDSTEDAAALMRAASDGRVSNGKQSSRPPEAMPLTEEQNMARFISELKPNQKQFLAALAHHAEGVDGSAFAKEIGLENRQMGAIAGAISKNCKRHQVKYQQLLLSETRFDGPRRFRFLKPKALLLKYAGKIQQENLRLMA